MNDRAVILNELAQGLRPLSQGLDWFENLADEEQCIVLRDLCQFCVQARATSEDALEAVGRSGLRPTHTPSVLIRRGRIDEQLGKVAGLVPHHAGPRRFACWSKS